MRTYTVTEAKPYLDGTIEVLLGQGPRSVRTVYRARPAKGSASHFLASERDARRWIDEHQIGGNPAGFLHELSQRRRFR